MSLRLFLDHVVHNAVISALADVAPGSAEEYYGVPIHLDATGRPYYQVQDEDAVWQTMIPAPLEGHVVQVSWWLRLPADFPVTIGRYGFNTAGVVVKDDGHVGLRAQFYGSELKDVYSLRYYLHTSRAVVLEPWQVPESEPPADFLEQFVGEALEAHAAANDPTFAPCARTGTALKIACGQCNAKYTLAIGKIAGRIVSIKCKKCGATFHIDGRPYAEASDTGTGNPPEPPPAN